MLTRRTFLKFLGSVGFFTLTPFRHLFPHYDSNSSYLQSGELFAGFLLLPEGAILPSFVQYPLLPMPRLCGVTSENEPDSPDALIRFYDSHEHLARNITFPVLGFSPLPADIHEGKAFSISFDTGELHSLSLDYDAYNKDTQWWGTFVSICIFAQYPKPFPLWKIEPISENSTIGQYEKVDILPTQGIKVQSQEGYVYYWILKDNLYILSIDPCPDENRANNIIDLLVQL